MGAGLSAETDNAMTAQRNTYAMLHDETIRRRKAAIIKPKERPIARGERGRIGAERKQRRCNKTFAVLICKDIPSRQ